LLSEVGRGIRQVSWSCSIGLGSAHEYLLRAEAAKITLADGILDRLVHNAHRAMKGDSMRKNRSKPSA
jgi:hypothetical protein